MTTTLGNKLGSFVLVDDGFSIAPATAWAEGGVFDLGENTVPQAEWLSVWLALNNTEYDIELSVQWSEDSLTWPDTGEGTLFAVMQGVNGPLSMSRVYELPSPQARYGRICFNNKHASVTATVSSYVSQNLKQSS